MISNLIGSMLGMLLVTTLPWAAMVYGGIKARKPGLAVVGGALGVMGAVALVSIALAGDLAASVGILVATAIYVAACALGLRHRPGQP